MAISDVYYESSYRQITWQIYPPPSIKHRCLVGNYCHFGTDCLHDYIHFTIYCLHLHFQCSEAQAISAISPKTCTLKLQLLHNMKRPTKWSGHVKIIDPQKTSTYKRPFTQEGNYLVVIVVLQEITCHCPQLSEGYSELAAAIPSLVFEENLRTLEQLPPTQ